MDSNQHPQPPNTAVAFVHDAPPRSDIDEILRRKRKAREYKVSECDLELIFCPLPLDIAKVFNCDCSMVAPVMLVNS